MELRSLVAFEAVVRELSFTKAAESLFLTQPAVTRQIASLELELHTRLFDRIGRTIRLTPSGEALHRYSAEILRLTHEAQVAIDDVAVAAAGRLAVGANSTTATYILPPLLRRFRQSYPNVELSIHTGISAQVVDMVLSNDVDVGVVSGFQDRPELIATPLTEYETGVVVYPGHPLAEKYGKNGGAVRTEELAGSPLILMEEGTNLRTYVDRLLSTAGVEERVMMEIDNVEAIKKMIEAGLGISLLPLISAQTEVDTGRLLALHLADLPTAHRRIEAIYRRDKYLAGALTAFLAMLRAEAGHK